MKYRMLFLATIVASSALLPFPGNSQIPTAGLALWLKADTGVTLNGETVSAWADQSGQQHEATQPDASSQPTLATSGTGKPALRFDGANDFLNFNVPIDGLEAMTIILVSNNTSPAQDGGTAFSDSPAIFWNETASWGWVFLGPFQANVNWRFGTTTPGNNHKYPRPASIQEAYSLTTLVKNADVETLYVDPAKPSKLISKVTRWQVSPRMAIWDAATLLTSRARYSKSLFILRPSRTLTARP